MQLILADAGWSFSLFLIGFTAGALIGVPAWNWVKTKLPWGK